MNLHEKKFRGGENRYVILQLKKSILVTMATRDLSCDFNIANNAGVIYR